MGYEEIAAKHAALRAWRKLTSDCHLAVARAVADGRLVRAERCEDCGAEGKLHGHHADYSKPLEVEWLCPRCHGRRHRTAPPRQLQPKGGHPGFGNPLNLKRSFR